MLATAGRSIFMPNILMPLSIIETRSDILFGANTESTLPATAHESEIIIGSQYFLQYDNRSLIAFFALFGFMGALNLGLGIFQFLRAKLTFGYFQITWARLQEFFVFAHSDDFTVLYDDNFVGVFYCANALGDNDTGGTF